jgi:hypothetical protein
MKKYLVVFILLIISIFNVSAQKSKDVLYLKNGSTVYGNLLEIVSDQYKIKTSDGRIFVFSASEVEKFSMEIHQFSGRKNDGFGFALEAGILLGSQDTEYEAPFSFNFLGGYTIKTKNIISIGSGVEFFGKPYIPLFLEYKYLILEKRVTPFIYMRGGGVMHLGGSDSETYDIYNQYAPYNYKGGLSLGIGTGISWARDEYESYLSFGYRYAHTSYEKKEYTQTSSTYESVMNRLEIKFGFRF